MIRRLLLVLALLSPAVLCAQSPSAWTQWPSTWIRWDGGTAVTFYSIVQNNGVNVPQEQVLNFVPGTNVSFSFADTPGNPGVTSITINSSAGGSGPLLSATDAVNTSPVRGGMVVANSTPKWAQVALGTAGSVWVAGATDPSWVAPNGALLGSPPQSIQFNGTSSIFVRQPFDSTTAEIVNQSFPQIGTSDGVAVINGFNITGAGTSAGFVHNKATATDANHLNFVELTTGTTTTGGANLGMGNTGATTGFLITGNEFIDWLIDIPVLSGTGGNNFRVSAGFYDTTAATTITNGAFVTVDNSVDSHWAVETCKAGTCTGPTVSTTVATAGWHHVSVLVNSAATSIAFYVDGTQLSSSPLTTNLPTTVPISFQTRIVASALCAAVGTCVEDVNTVYFYKPVTR